MAHAPGFKVYNPAGEYIAACKHIEDAAALVALNGNGSTIRDGHRIILWAEGKEDQPAGESYDHVAEVAAQRRAERIAKANAEREAQHADYLAKHPELKHVATVTIPRAALEG